VLDNPDLVAGRTVFDLASGSGLVAIVAARSGAASVVACDLDPQAATAMAINARANGVSITPLLADVLAEDVDAEVVLAGDVFYDKDMSARVLPFLERASARGALVLVGDPSRPYLPRARFEVAAHYSVPVPRDLEGVLVLPTTVWRLLPRDRERVA
jgi:predicted nicotinamide N-methyase